MTESRLPELPRAARALIDAAEAMRMESLHDREERRDGFVASDPVQVYGALARIADRGLAPGEIFCEWGSGLGVVAGLAAQIGFESCGIEIQHELVTAATELAREFELPVNFARGTFVPERSAHLPEIERAENPWWHIAAPSGYGELGIDPGAVDLVFAYPWPGEQPIIEAIFRHCAAEGALLLTHEDGSGVRLQRKRNDLLLEPVEL